MTGASRTTWTVLIAALAAATLAALAGCGYTFTSTRAEVDTDLPADAAAETVADASAQAGPKRYQVFNGYSAGSVHPTGVQTVYVNVFQSQDFRRELEFRLSEALVKRILLNTPYRIAPKDRADTVLEGEISYVSVTLLGSDFDSDLPKENQPVLVCNWTWRNRRTGEVLAQRSGMEQASEFIPLGGETFFDGTEEGIDDLAERIVEAMESPW